MKQSRLSYFIPFGIVGLMVLLQQLLPGNRGFLLQVIIYTIYVMGNNILMGYMGYVSFGQPIYLSLGGYAAGLYLFYIGGNPLIAFGLSIVVGVLAGIVMGPVLIRLRGSYFTLVNAAFCAIGVFTFETLLIGITNGNNGLLFRSKMQRGFEFLNLNPYPRWLDLRRPDNFYFFALAILFVILLLYMRMDRSTLGAMFRATEKNERRMKFLGYNTFNIRWFGFILASVLCTLAGGLYALNNAMVNPSLGEQSRASEVVVATLMGGSGTVFGPFLGALSFLGIKEIISVYIGRWELLVGIITLVIMFKFPMGIGGFLSYLFNRKDLPSRTVSIRKKAADK